MPDSSDPPTPPCARNLRFLAALDPALGARLAGLTGTYTRAVVEHGVAVDIELGDGRLYRCDGAAFAAEQVASFMAKPTRLVVNRPDPDRLSDPCSRELVERFAARLAAEPFDLTTAPAEGRSGILFVVGVGLGFHLGPLIERTRPRHVVLVEPIGEFLRHACDAIDWRALHLDCEARGATLAVVCEDDVVHAVARLENLIAGFGETTIDGSFIYVHYTTPATRAIAGKIHEFAGMASILKGYFADERLMVENSSANLAERAFRVVDGSALPPLGVPAFVIGSGPSLDGAIEAIRRNRDHAVLITAGSALQVLLHHGIVPDWHVEKENLPLSAERLRHIMARNRDRFPGGRFTGVRLLASTTVDPGIVELFDDVWLFFRSALSSTAMFGASRRAVDGTSPYSANAALTLAGLLGFRDIYLFGCDCGARAGTGHHSGQTAYYTLDASREAARATGRYELPHRAPANFGGEVETNSYFLWSRRTFEQVIAALGLRAKNCSDGAAIAGAAPLPPEELALAGAPADRAALDARLFAATDWYPAGGYLADQDVAGAVAGWRAFARGLRRRLDTLERTATDIHALHRGVCAWLDGAAARHGAAAILAGGTLRALPPLAGYWLNRAPDDAGHAELFAWFRAQYRAIVEDALRDGDALMAAVGGRAVAARAAAGLMQSA
jgi:hypothetical protein